MTISRFKISILGDRIVSPSGHIEDFLRAPSFPLVANLAVFVPPISVRVGMFL